MKVVVVGARGKMGQVLIEALVAERDLEIAGTADVDTDLPALLTGVTPDVAVDFTTPAAINDNLLLYLEAGVRPVVGTTGIRDEVLAEARARAEAQRIGGVIAPNFSLGAVLMMELSTRVASHLREVEITELHHPQKIDVPSGTALRTRDKIRRATGQEAPIHSMRLPGFLASQEVIFGSAGERLTIRHDSIDRHCFMPGVLLAIRRSIELRQLVVGLEHLLDL